MEPLPGQYTLTLPAIMLKIWHSLMLSVDVVPMLIAGAPVRLMLRVPPALIALAVATVQGAGRALCKPSQSGRGRRQRRRDLARQAGYTQ